MELGKEPQASVCFIQNFTLSEFVLMSSTVQCILLDYISVGLASRSFSLIKNLGQLCSYILLLFSGTVTQFLSVLVT